MASGSARVCRLHCLKVRLVYGVALLQSYFSAEQLVYCLHLASFLHVEAMK